MLMTVIVALRKNCATFGSTLLDSGLDRSDAESNPFPDMLNNRFALPTNSQSYTEKFSARVHFFLLVENVPTTIR
jgi:hypothetical protein